MHATEDQLEARDTIIAILCALKERGFQEVRLEELSRLLPDMLHHLGVVCESDEFQIVNRDGVSEAVRRCVHFLTETKAGGARKEPLAFLKRNGGSLDLFLLHDSVPVKYYNRRTDRDMIYEATSTFFKCSRCIRAALEAGRSQSCSC